MSLYKLWLFTMLAAVIALVAVERLDAQIKGFGAPTPNLRPTVLLPVQSKNAKDLGAGKLLVASRGLGDPEFAQTVVLLVRYDAEGVLGLILNRRSDLPLSRVLEGITAAKGRSDPVYLGGPVEPSVFALLQSPAKVEGAEHIFGTVYMISTKPLLEQTISARPGSGSFHVYLGSAGWAHDQLRKEVELGAWFIFPADAGTVFNADPESLWPQMILKTELKFAGSGPADAHRASAARSPDSKWLAYANDETGHQEVYIQPFPSGPGRWQVSTAGGFRPGWRKDGKELYFFSLDQKMMTVDVNQNGASLRLGAHDALFKAATVSGPAGVYIASPDGKKFVMNTVLPQSMSEPLTLTTNWPADLKQ